MSNDTGSDSSFNQKERVLARLLANALEPYSAREHPDQKERDTVGSAVRAYCTNWLALWHEASIGESQSELNDGLRLAYTAERRALESGFLEVIDSKVKPMIKAYTQFATKLTDKVYFHTLLAEIYAQCRLVLPGKWVEEVECAKGNYRTAQDAADELDPADPLRLSVGLSFSTFLQEALVETERACQLAKLTFDNAIAVFDELSQEQKDGVSPIMGELRGKLTLWSAGSVEEDDV